MPISILLFPLLAAGVAAGAWLAPGLFAAQSSAIVPLLSLVMFGMGASTPPQAFIQVMRRPQTLAAGLLLQFGLMPAIAWALAQLLSVDPALQIGLILVGVCSGGTASNVICYLAGGNLALSISLTFASTVLGVVLTPLLAAAYLGAAVDVPAQAMLVTLLQVVAVPVGLGLVAHQTLHHRAPAVLRWLPRLSMAAILWIIAIVVALNAQRLGSLGGAAWFAVVAHNLCGLGGGWLGAALLRQDETTRRTLAIEVGMQNSGLAVALATQYFSAAAALPGALFSVWHNLSGAGFAALSQYRSRAGAQATAPEALPLARHQPPTGRGQ